VFTPAYAGLVFDHSVTPVKEMAGRDPPYACWSFQPIVGVRVPLTANLQPAQLMAFMAYPILIQMLECACGLPQLTRVNLIIFFYFLYNKTIFLKNTTKLHL
jgi:hypothetical protein